MTLVRTLAVAALCSSALSPLAASAQDPLHAWTGGADPAGLERWVNARLAQEKADVDKLVAVKGARTIDNTVRPYDDALNELALAGNEAYLMYSVGDSAPLRDKGQELVSKVSSATTDLNLNQQVYRALAAVPLPTSDPATKHYIERALLEYRLAGVDKDDATRAKIRGLQDKITESSLIFGRNVADGKLEVSATKAELDGLPEDYIVRHKPNASGVYTLNTDSPDSTPVFNFATSPDLRKRMYLSYNQRAYPKNTSVLKSILETRQELATTLGYKTFADLAMADQMMGSASNLKTFLEQVDTTSRTVSDKEYKLLFAFAETRQPGLKSIPASDGNYWAEQYRRAKYDFDAQSVRPYFPYMPVQEGILTTAAHLFHVEFKAVPDAKTWHPSVSTYDVFDAVAGDHKKLGRIYLDMHPREGKDKWFSSAPVVPGINGKQLPEGALICNFPGGEPGDPGLMEYSDVVTFFHEFGHLMHHILGGQGQWSNAGGFNVEGDFVEAPSQMLEEMFRDRGILSAFAKNYKTGEVIPAALVEKMNAAGAYGRGRWVQSQLLYSTFALQVHDRPPTQIDFDSLWREDFGRFSQLQFVDGNRFYDSFTHLTGYSSNYYTYMLDKVIAVDFFSKFDRSNLLGGPAAMRYRKTVLEPGAAKPATELVKDFLGREQSLDALKTWMNEEFETSDTKMAVQR
ncbi:M3 family metallopeptidase [Edaphobacter modestus]|uniref:Thimet oligopeptidase n=1 Tax=Edaphobacter modestus TaxID=388466 RepID=A0A4Q7YWQ8_9BACT|nr:M3 family metallopeptidase [Edaphobacter modestus]RZU41525.1 thimet oligopeptidase [Edaphobacter modestus]